MAELRSRSLGNTRDHLHTHVFSDHAQNIHNLLLCKYTSTLMQHPPENSLNWFTTFIGNVFSLAFLSPEGIFTQRGGWCPLQKSTGLSSHHYQHFVCVSGISERVQSLYKGESHGSITHGLHFLECSRLT